MVSHIEVIDPREKVQGYRSPAFPSSVNDLVADIKHSEKWGLNTAVWKVKREKDEPPRRLTLPNGRRLRCKILGGTGSDWWFVSVCASDALTALAASAKESEQ